MLLDDSDLPEQYYCEECHPSDHEILLGTTTSSKKRGAEVRMRRKKKKWKKWKKKNERKLSKS